MKTIKTAVCLFILLGAFNSPVFSQEDTTAVVDNRPVKATFETYMIVDNQTVTSPFKGSLSMVINHRFGSMENGISDLFGIYAGANTRLGLQYGITDRIMIGIGTTQDYKLQDIEWKYAILRQTRSNSMPVSLSYFGNLVIDARSDDNFGPEESYKFIHRLSYFTQLIVSRRFSDVFSFQVAPEMAYFNGVDQSVENVNFGLSLGGRAQIWSGKSFILEYDIPFTMHESFDPQPNLGAGFEIATATHAFQIFVSNYHDIVYQRNLAYNKNTQFQIGFNITVRF